MSQSQKEENHGLEQAGAQLESIKALVAALNAATGDEQATEAAQQAIFEDPLSVEVRSGWHTPGISNPDNTAEEFKILLCTGGPAVQIIGNLSEHGEPDKVWLQYQDWFTPWQDYPLTSEEHEIVLMYCRQFYFAE